jgi:alpha-beta hydrolase superfamily lysophospholipase
MEKLSYQSFDHDHFNYLKWSNSSNPCKVIIAVHGINGAAQDFDGLARYLTNNDQHIKAITIYAPETRGQGNDHNIERRGDILHEEEWSRDLSTFHQMIQSTHPNAEIIWCGESMGSLIIIHTLNHLTDPHLRPDKIILLAPVVSLLPHLPKWKHKLATLISYFLPRYRVSLNLFSGGQAVKVTQSSDNHDDQAATNSYFIEKFTLRLLSSLGNIISKMNVTVEKIHVPILVINGGCDYFTPPEYTHKFFSCIPFSEKNHHAYFAESYHLLLYDDHRNEIFSEISRWISV